MQYMRRSSATPQFEEHNLNSCCEPAKKSFAQDSWIVTLVENMSRRCVMRAVHVMHATSPVFDLGAVGRAKEPRSRLILKSGPMLEIEALFMGSSMVAEST